MSQNFNFLYAYEIVVSIYVCNTSSQSLPFRLLYLAIAMCVCLWLCAEGNQSFALPPLPISFYIFIPLSSYSIPGFPSFATLSCLICRTYSACKTIQFTPTDPMHILGCFARYSSILHSRSSFLEFWVVFTGRKFLVCSFLLLPSYTVWFSRACK